MKRSRPKQLFTKMILTMAIVLMVSVGVLTPRQPAHAQLSVPILESITLGQNIWEQVLNNVGEFLLQAGTVAAANLLQTYGQKVAKDAAEFVVTGDWGQNPLVYRKGWEDYLTDAGYGAAGAFLDTLSENLTATDAQGNQYGFNLCTPNAPYLLYGIPAALFGQFKASEVRSGVNGQITTPRCNFKQVLDTWEAQAEELNPTVFLSEFKQVFDIGQNDLSIAANAIIQGNLAVLSAKKEAELERAQSNTYRDLVSKISRQVITPKKQVEEAAELSGAKAAAQQQQDLQNSLIASGKGVAVAIAGSFVNTLASRLMEKYFTEGVVPVAGIGLDFPTEFSQGTGAKQAFDAVYADLYTPQIQEATTVDIVNDFLACPSQFPQQNNCTLDAKFAQAIQAAQTREPVTVGLALERGGLHGEWKLLPPSDPRNSQTTCATEAYCFSNLVKLRRARIIPIGWEIAAQNAPAGGVSLNEVVSNYHTCNYETDPNGVADALHPYCHLIDPNWVLKAPETQCRAQGYTTILQSSEGARRQLSCVDDATCVVTDANGECAGVWGYCTREKNAWRFEGNTCEEQFASCQTLGTRDGTEVSLLLNTVDSEFCSEDNVGCRAYYTEQNAGVWDVAGERLYLNQFAQSCSAQAAGCSLLTDNDFSEIYLQVPPKELGCTGNPDTDPIACGNYAPICEQKDVGCTLYTPTNGDPAVAGIESAGLQCAAQCVGYAQFAQQPTTLEPFGTIEYFIPSTAQTCAAAEVGCTSFTVVSGPNPEAIVHFSDLQQCITPEEAANDTFYTWEGSDTVGLQLKTFEFKVDQSPDAAAQGTGESGVIHPEYAVTDPGLLSDFYQNCNAEVYLNREIDPNYDPDCREFFDKSGKRVYRMLSEVIVASDQCAVLRRNDAVSADTCTQTGGTPAEGGEFCLYNALQSMSQTCSENAAQCRAYEGTEAGAGQIVYLAEFEQATTDWSQTSLSTEAVAVGGHSAKASAQTISSPQFGATRDMQYTVTFWAKGNESIEIGLQFGQSNEPGTEFTTQTVTLDSVWRQYTVGPFSTDLVQADAANIISFVQSGNGDSQYFLDNVFVKEAKGVHFLIKDSWNTPEQCDANPFDNLPGAALGCREYTNHNNELTYNTGFERVCREEVAGCQALINTFNSEDPGTQTFNFNDGNPDIDGQLHPEDDVVVPADDIIYIVNREQWRCGVENLGCQAVGEERASGEITTTYIKNQPDNYETQLCKAFENRCDAFSNGTQTQYFKDPGYNTCIFKDKLGMSDGTRKSGWFKSNSLAGGTPEACDPGLVSGGNQFGIWKNGDEQYTGQVGLCSQASNGCTEFVDHHDRSDAQPLGKSYYFIKNSSLDTTSCGGQVNLNEGCVLLDDTSNPVKNWSSAQTEHEAGKAQGASVPPEVAAELPTPENINTTISTFGLDVTCNAELMARQCSTLAEGEFDGLCQHQAACLDALGTTVEVTTANDLLIGDKFSGGLVSYAVMCYQDLRLGTLLEFCDTQPAQDNELNSVCQSYETAVFAQSLGVDTVESNTRLIQSEDVLKKVRAKASVACGINDSNTVVKVERDRVCSEWLSCKTSFTVWDERTNKGRDVCVDVGTCAQWSTGADGTGECVRWVEDTDTNDQILTRELYSERDISWFGADYSGYSLYNQFQLADLNPIVTDNEAQPVALAYTNANENGCGAKVDGDACSFALNGTSLNGICYNSRCAIAPNAGGSASGVGGLVPQSCRAYAEQDSPFPETVVEQYNDFGDPIVNFASHRNANVCQKDQEQCNAGCGYQKVFYGQTKVLPRYYDTAATVPGGICQGGFTETGESKDGKTCQVRSECSDDRVGIKDEDRESGTCQQLKAAQRVYGTEGYCLEQDLRNSINGAQDEFACQTWFPATLLSGSVDTFNQYTSAGYEPPTVGGGRYFCTEARGNSERALTYGVGGNIIDACQDACHEFLLSQGSSNTWCNPNSELYQGHEYACEMARKLDPDDPRFMVQMLNRTGNKYLDSQPYKLVVGVGADADDGPNGPTNTKDFVFGRVVEDHVWIPVEDFGMLKQADIQYSDIERIGLYVLPVGKDDEGFDWMKWHDELIIYPDKFLGPIESPSENPENHCVKDEDNCTYVSGPVNQEIVGELCSGSVKNDKYGYSDDQLSFCGKKVPFEKRMRLLWQEENILGNNETTLKQVTPFSINLRDPEKERCHGQNAFFFDAAFDENTDKFKGFNVRVCDGSTGSATVKLAVIFHLREYCTEITEVHSEDSNALSLNKAWTDRVKTGSEYILDGGDHLSDGVGGPGGAGKGTLKYAYGQEFTPFGSSLASEPPQNEEVASGVVLPWYVSSDATNLPDKAGFINGGSPLSCQSTTVSSEQSCTSNRCIGGQNHGSFCNTQSDCPSQKITTPSGQQIIEYGLCMGVARPESKFLEKVGEIGTVEDFESKEFVPVQVSPEFGKELLSRIFAAQFTKWRWQYAADVEGFTYQAEEEGGVSGDTSFDHVAGAPVDSTELYPPRIQSVKCELGVCGPGDGTTNTLGINGFESGNVVTASDSLTVQMQFYTDVAPNQMPIKRIAVDWDEAGKDPSFFEGSYKNRKAECTGATFGDSEDACTEGFYQFVHHYDFANCESPQVVDADDPLGQELISKHGFNAGDQFCQFVPAVQLLDNWGWCNAPVGSAVLSECINVDGNRGGCWNDLEKDKELYRCSIQQFNKASSDFNGSVIVRKTQ